MLRTRSMALPVWRTASWRHYCTGEVVAVVGVVTCPAAGQGSSTLSSLRWASSASVRTVAAASPGFVRDNALQCQRRFNSSSNSNSNNNNNENNNDKKTTTTDGAKGKEEKSDKKEDHQAPVDEKKPAGEEATATTDATPSAETGSAVPPPPPPSPPVSDDAAAAASPSSASSSTSSPSADASKAPKGFEGFYASYFTSKMTRARTPQERLKQSYTVSLHERLLLLHMAREEYQKRNVRRLVVVLVMLSTVMTALYFRNHSLLQEDVSAYRAVLVDLPSHSARFLNEHGKTIGVRTFIDFHAFESTCDPERDVMFSIATYYPWVPMLLLCLLPVLALVNTSFNSSARLISSMASQKEKGRFRFQRDMAVSTRLKDVAGLTEAKGEVMEVVDFLKNPQRYQALGAKLPKGVLLDGPPGVGKTLLAKAVAGEAMVPFVSCSGSEFEEVYVGVGAQRVRELFKEAHKCKPCVVFVDEIDAFGRKRRSDGNGNSRNTLNAFLSEMDGFKDASGIMVLAATNRSDILDNALTRSGRFDRKISLDNPSYKDRVAIAEVHLRPLTLDPSTKVQEYAETIAGLTPGCSGADIFNVCNEAAIQGAREGSAHVTVRHFHMAVERVLLGLEKSAVKYTPHERERLAYHEAGLVVLGWFQPETDPVIKTTILPRGQHRTGITQKLPQNTYISTQERLLQQIVARLGGYVSEEFFFHDVSTSAAHDLQTATRQATQMVCVYGMDPEHVGHFGYELNRDDALQKPFGPAKEDAIDHSVEAIMATCMARARDLLQAHVQHTRVVAGLLLQQETLTAQELWFALGDRPHMSKEFKTYLES